MTSTVASTSTRGKKDRWSWKKWEPAFYIAPAFLVLIVILIYPLGYSLFLSFHDWNVHSFRTAIPFVGLENYLTLFTDSDFLHSISTTFLFMAGALSLEFVLGMGLALLLNRDFRGRNLVRSLVLLPMMCTNVVIGLTWRLLYNYEFGIINYYLTRVGLHPVEWLSNVSVALPSVILVDVWNTTSFVALMLLAGLQALPDEPYEAALIDGATPWQSFVYLTLPLLRPTILVALLWRAIDTFRIFDVIYLLTAGGPARATETVSIYVYRYGFQTFNLGFASASSYIMILILLVLAAAMARLIGRSGQS